MKEIYEFPIANTLDDNQHLIFYKIMGYDVPREYTYFLYEKKWWEKQEDILRGKSFPPETEQYTRTQKNPYMESMIQYIQKYAWLYKSIPFVQSLYLCNSITFNALHEMSDIDLFIVTKKWALWRARAWSVLMFFIMWIKRGKIRGKKRKFCLSFYVTQSHQNLYSIMLPQNDIYFIYWLAHLVPLYQEQPENIYTYNTRIEGVLPNFPGRHCIDIGIQTVQWSTSYKKIVEYLQWWYIGNFLEYLIQWIRVPILRYKTKQLGERWRGIIVNKNILKFHMDIRKKIHLLYTMYKKKITKK